MIRLCFTSDNGHYKTESNLFNQPYRGVKGQTLEGGIRVPYIFKWKNKIEAGSQSKEPIIHVDIYPTLLGLTNTAAPENYVVDGEDLSPLLFAQAEKTDRRALIWQYTNYARWNNKRQEFASSWVNVIQMDGFKMTENIETSTYTLYNLNDDPYETKEVALEYPEMIQRLKARLQLWKQETGSEKPRVNPALKVFS
jgi:Arylsulfatase A and related enzymes